MEARHSTEAEPSVVDDYAIGWRYWFVDIGRRELQSLMSSTVWPVGIALRAENKGRGCAIAVVVSFAVLTVGFWLTGGMCLRVALTTTAIAPARAAGALIMMGLFMARVALVYWRDTPKDWQVVDRAGINAYASCRPGGPDRLTRLIIWCGFHALIYGKVALWGEVLEHEDGYRAEYAYPLEITHIYSREAGQMVPAAGSPLAVDVSERYGLTVPGTRAHETSVLDEAARSDLP